MSCVGMDSRENGPGSLNHRGPCSRSMFIELSSLVGTPTPRPFTCGSLYRLVCSHTRIGPSAEFGAPVIVSLRHAHAGYLLWPWESHERAGEERIHFGMGLHWRPDSAAACDLVDLRALVCSCHCGNGDEYAAHDP